MKTLRFLLVIGCFGLLLSLVPSGAQALQRCLTVCTPTASCSLQCIATGGMSPEITTCGEWGVCGGGFNSSLVPASSTQAGASVTLVSDSGALACKAVQADVAVPLAEAR